MADRVALITGAGKGIGRGLALAFAGDGALVIATDIDIPALEETRRQAGADAERIVPMRLDVTDAGDIARVFAWLADAHPQLDTLVNCAGVTRKIDFFDLTAEDVDWINGVNIRGTMLVMQAAARLMRDQGRGQIINISSIAGKGFRETTTIAYAASKGAIVTMSRIAAARLGAYGITVNAVCPGMTETEMMRDWMQETARVTGRSLEETRDSLVQSTALKRTNSVADVAASVLFLASPAARNITGQSINIDGGIMWD